MLRRCRLKKRLAFADQADGRLAQTPMPFARKYLLSLEKQNGAVAKVEVDEVLRLCRSRQQYIPRPVHTRGNAYRE